MVWRGLVNVALVCLLPVSMVACSTKFPEQIRLSLEQAEQFDLLSIHPDPAAKGNDRFHDWAILGRMTVTDIDARQRILAAFRQGIEESDGAVAACFNPRHGIRVTRNGRTTDFVICFQCFQVYVFADGKGMSISPVTRSPEAYFDAVLRSARLPLARELNKVPLSEGLRRD